MKVSDKGVTFIRFRECIGGKIPLQIYFDEAGNPTIGIGHLLRTGERDKFRHGITSEHALRLFRDDIQPIEDELNNTFRKGFLSQHEFDALASFIFNIGIGKRKKNPDIGFAGSDLKKYLLEGDKAAAAEQFMVWNKVTKVVNGERKKVRSRGLTNRRQMERNLFLKGIYPDEFD